MDDKGNSPNKLILKNCIERVLKNIYLKKSTKNPEKLFF